MSDSIDTIPTLREFLEAGCDLAAIDRHSLGFLAENVILCHPYMDYDTAFDRELAQMLLDGRTPHWLGVDAPARMHREGYDRRTHAMMLCWGAECAEHPELVDRLEAALPAELRADIAEWREAINHPNRLLVGPAEECERVACSACGEQLAGLVVTVDNVDAVSYCARCITLVAAAVAPHPEP